MQINITELSSQYAVRRLTADDVELIYGLSIENPLFYQYCPPFVTRESILEDMKALPPRTTCADKFYIGFFRDEKLIAIMDLILHYPNGQTAFIGLFMMSRAEQGKGIGSKIIEEGVCYLKGCGFHSVRLAFAKGNPQSEAFWTKNGFAKTGTEHDNGGYIAVSMQRIL